MKKILALVACLSLVASLAVGGSIAYLQDQKATVNVMTLGKVDIAVREYERVLNDDGTYEMLKSEKYNAEGFKLQPYTQNKPLLPAVGKVTGYGTPVYFDQLDEGASGGMQVLDGIKNVQDKFVFVENTGKSEAYVRTLIAFEVGNAENAITPNGTADTDLIEISDSADGEPWACNHLGSVEIDGNKYYVIEYLYTGNNDRHTGGLLPAGEWTYNNLAQIYMTPKATNEDVEAIDGNKNGKYDILVLAQAVQAAGFDNAETALDTAFGEPTAVNPETNNQNIADWFGGVTPVHSAATAEELKAALAEGGTVVLSADVNMADEQLTIPAGKDVTIDLAGYDLTGNFKAADHYAMFTIPNGASLTINGNGEVKANTEATDNNKSLALFLNAGKLTINGGTYNVTDASEGKTWIIATIVDNRTNSASCEAVLTINGGDFSVGGNAKNLFRNYPQQGGSATIIFNDGKFNAHATADTTYIWNQEASNYLGELYFNGGTYDAKVVYEDYNGQSDIHIAEGVTIGAYSGNN